MSDFELAYLRIRQGHRVRFYQDYYGRQWVKVQGGLRFWRSGRIYLRDDEIIALKRYVAKMRSVVSGAEASGRTATA